MLKKIDIYGHDKKLDTYMRRIADSEEITDANKTLLVSFRKYLVMQGLSVARVLKYMEVLCTTSRMIKKDFAKLTKQDVEEFVSEIIQRDYSPWTKQVYKLMLRRLLTWMNKGKIPKTVDWYKVHFNKSEKNLPGEGDMITEEEINTVMSKCNNIRDKCLLSVLYESGCRIGEIASMRIGNVIFDKYGVMVSVIGKTGARKIRLVKSTSLLKMLIESHQDKTDPASPLWVKIGNRGQGDPMNYSTIRKKLLDMFKKVGIKKRCNPHMFRHSRATQMASHLTEFQMNQYFGWIQGSDMPSTYVHLSGRDVEGAVLAMNGIKLDEEEEVVKDAPVKCVRCEFINPHATTHCIRCNQILDEKTAIAHEEQEKKQQLMNTVMNELIKEPQIQQLLVQKVAELGLKESVLGQR